MRNKPTLSIAIVSLSAIGAFSLQAHAGNTDGASAIAKSNTTSKPASKGGKCASGKCGTEKIYSRAMLDKNPQDRLVRTRDGKCGVTGQGHDIAQTPTSKLAEGVCGQ